MMNDSSFWTGSLLSSSESSASNWIELDVSSSPEVEVDSSGVAATSV